MKIIVGIDYGAKKAGTTVICYQKLSDNKLHFQAVEKGKDADQFIYQTLQKLQVSIAFIDAPLSLPGVYTQPQKYQNYFYRVCDQQLQAMSPMFLGGLTARAMQLKAKLQAHHIQLLETYPSYHAQQLQLKNKGYKKQKAHMSTICAIINQQNIIPSLHIEMITDWHHIDAALALFTAKRYLLQQHRVIGDSQEGLIYL